MFIEINVICEIPFYFINTIIINKIICTTMTLTSGHEFDPDFKKKINFFKLPDNFMLILCQNHRKN